MVGADPLLGETVVAFDPRHADHLVTPLNSSSPWLQRAGARLRAGGDRAFGSLRSGVEVVWSDRFDQLTMEREKGFEPSTSTLAGDFGVVIRVRSRV